MHIKYLGTMMLPIFLAVTACSQNASAPTLPANGYNAELATKLGADDYGMRSYVMVVLKTGPKDSVVTDEVERKEIFAGHFSNMKNLAEAQKLVLSGPFMDGGDKRGLYIFNVATIEEAKPLVETDPAVAAGIFVPEFTKYYGSAALMDIQNVHKTIQKTKIG